MPCICGALVKINKPMWTHYLFMAKIPRLFTFPWFLPNVLFPFQDATLHLCVSLGYSRPCEFLRHSYFWWSWQFWGLLRILWNGLQLGFIWCFCHDDFGVMVVWEEGDQREVGLITSHPSGDYQRDSPLLMSTLIIYLPEVVSVECEVSLSPPVHTVLCRGKSLCS